MPQIACQFCAYDLTGTALVDAGRLCPECGRFNPADAPPKPRWDWRRWWVPMAIGWIGTVTLCLLIGAAAPDGLAMGLLVILASAAVGAATGLLSAAIWIVINLCDFRNPTDLGARIWRVVYHAALAGVAACVVSFMAASVSCIVMLI